MSNLDLDALLNSALDDLEVYEKKKKEDGAAATATAADTPATLKQTTTTTVATASTSSTPSTPISTTSTTTTTTTSAAASSSNAAAGMGNMMDMFSQMFNDKSMDDLIKNMGYDKMEDMMKDMNDYIGSAGGDGDDSGSNPAGTALPAVPGMPDGSNFESIYAGMSESEKKEMEESFGKFSKMFSSMAGDSTSAAGIPNMPPAAAQQQQPAGINFKDFESNISGMLKGLADNAAQQGGKQSFEDDMIKQFASMMGSGGEGGGEFNGMADGINDFYDDSMKYIVEKYPQWIEENKDKYTPEEISNFSKQNDVFQKLYKSGEDVGQEEMYDKISMLGQLPEAFCEQYCKEIQERMEKDMAAVAPTQPGPQ
ncbi:hypothetical protein SAMD00019534_098360 [Acytostelium subglobosum LB1]|uniref:hypothetical protein n=1 Tax=Acytostelium subglobosum LB1 TaxID=1410327 RepID=UPI000644A054|nr:hypothetical protein SAMD00019534_098360 [Acytostelium subglobosum LB1]GAM26661.1 hypothetical protein SAMD00019534_098360 [Acytostelium subglobosum LB1]|eukprot:XP_012750322.1 hypothetical protein SAMD00019534_098360 [Acytostelium subglobosum LB1]